MILYLNFAILWNSTILLSIFWLWLLLLVVLLVVVVAGLILLVGCGVVGRGCVCLVFLIEIFSHQNISKCLTAYIFGVSILLGSSFLTSLTHNSTQQDLDRISLHSPAQPSFNCLTTEASCVFAHEAIDVASQDLDPVFHPIAQRRKRSSRSFLQRQGFKNITTAREENMVHIRTQETLPLSSENHTFPGSIDNISFLGTLHNYMFPNITTAPVSPDYYSNDTDRELNRQLTMQSVPVPLCIHKMKESYLASNISSFEPQIVNKGCFEEFIGSHVSSRDLNCFHRQQLCVAWWLNTIPTTPIPFLF